MKKIEGSNNFSAQFIKIISHCEKIVYNINVLQQNACLVVNPIACYGKQRHAVIGGVPAPWYYVQDAQTLSTPLC